jgi:hypothetical protein
VRYEQLTSLLAKAIQQIATISGSFKDALVAWLGSAENGITDLFAKVGHFNQVCAKNSDGTETCITGDQLKAMLEWSAAAGATGSGNDGGAPASQPASTGGEDASTTSTTTQPEADPITSASSTLEAPPPANDNAAATSPPEAANDNLPPLQSTRTGATSSGQ